MSIVGLAQERPDSPQASFELGKFHITRKFLVHCSSVLDGPATVALAPGLPLLFAPYQFGSEFLPFLRCRAVDPERLAPGATDWEVTCHYETPDWKDASQGDGGHESGGKGDGKSGDGGGTGQEHDGQFTNPLLMIPEVETHFENHKEVIYGVYNPATQVFQPAAASTGEIFVPAPERDRSHLIMTITRNEDIATPHPALAVTYQDKVNQDSFWGASPGQVKCQSITVQRLVKNYPDGSFLPYLKATYVFHFRDTWDLQLLDQGTWYWYQQSMSSPKKKKKFQTDDNQNTQGLLDGNGGALATGGTPVFLTLQLYDRVPFAALNLPQSFLQVQ